MFKVLILILKNIYEELNQPPARHRQQHDAACNLQKKTNKYTTTTTTTTTMINYHSILTILMHINSSLLVLVPLSTIII